MGATPTSRQRRDAIRLVLSVPALETQGSLGVRSFWIPPAALTLVWVAERCRSTTQIPIRQLARQHSCSTPAAHKTPLLELMRWSLTTVVTPTRALATLRS